MPRLPKSMGFAKVGTGNTDLWQLNAEGEAYSPACEGEVDDKVLDFLEKLERGPGRARLNRLHDDRKKRREEEKAREDAEAARKVSAKKRINAVKQRLTAERLHKNNKLDEDDGTPAPPTPLPQEGSRLTRDKQEEVTKRLYEAALLKRRDKEVANSEKKLKKEESTIRKDYPKLEDDVRNAKLAEWSYKGSKKIADRRALQYEALRNASTADTITKDDVLSHLVWPGEEGGQLLEGWESQPNACLDKNAPWRPTSNVEMYKAQIEADMQLLKKPKEVYEAKKVPEETLPHSHWASEGAKRLARKVVLEITERHRVKSWLDPGNRLIEAATVDEVQRQEILASLVEPHEAADKAYKDLENPYKNTPKWERYTPKDTTKRDGEVDKQFVFKPNG